MHFFGVGACIDIGLNDHQASARFDHSTAGDQNLTSARRKQVDFHFRGKNFVIVWHH